VVVVDNCSVDGSREVAQEVPFAEVVALTENVGFGRACNIGVTRVDTPAVALLNPDVELVDDSLLALATEALRGDRPDRLLAPLVLNGDGSRQDSVHPAPSSLPDLVRSLVPPAAVPTPVGASLWPWRSKRSRRVGWAVGCALVGSTAMLCRLGPFDETIFLYGEDLELGLRAAQDGVETWFWPTARVIHHGAHSARSEFGEEPYDRLVRARHDVVSRRLGPARAAVDDRAQAVTFASRLAIKRSLGIAADRERRQLAALRSMRRPARRR
jgi:GT2 family glycosyltransferase